MVIVGSVSSDLNSEQCFGAFKVAFGAFSAVQLQTVELDIKAFITH